MAEPETPEAPETITDTESALSKRLGRLHAFQKDFPHLGRFGAEQYEGTSWAYGEKLLPPDRVGQDDDFIFGIANIRRKDLRFIMKVYTKAEKQLGREISLSRWLKIYLWLTRSIGSVGAEQYIRLGPAGLAPVQHGPGFIRKAWRRFRGTE